MKAIKNKATVLNKSEKITPEYQDFLDNTSERQKSEWIDGKLIIQSPAKKSHLSISKRLTRLMSAFADRYDLGYVAFEKALINLIEGEQNYEPDIVFFTKEKVKEMHDETSMFGIPDFVVEIVSKSTEKYDRGVKFSNYEKAGVTEYWIIVPKTKTIEQYILENGKYSLIKTHKPEDYIKSKTLNGFFVPVSSVFSTYANLAELDRPIRSVFEQEIKYHKKNIEEKDKTIEEKDKAIEEKDKTIEEKDKTIEENLKTIEETNNSMISSIILMKKSGISIEEIISVTNKSKEFIENC